LNAYAVEPAYLYIGYYSDEGLAPAQYGDYWGYLDQRGNKAIGFMFDDESDFVQGCAYVKVNGNWGVIDTQGNTVVETAYSSIEFDTEFGFIRAYIGPEAMYLFDFNGNQLFENLCYDYEVINNIFYLKGSEGYIPYDLSYNKLIGSGTEFPGIYYVSLPQNGILIGTSESKTKNQYGANVNGWYQYIDENIHLALHQYYDYRISVQQPRICRRPGTQWT
jgi:hypothetical protein